MKDSLLKKIIKSVNAAKKFNSSQTVAPQVILWPDPESQWITVIDTIRENVDALLTYGEYVPDKLQGPAIWIKCMVNQSLPEADWEEDEIPIIYLPGISKEDFKKIEEASNALQPLMEYQFTGSIWLQESGREWTILAFLQNKDQGLGLDVSRDTATKDALVKALPRIFEDKETIFRKKVDADFLNELMFPQVIPTLLDWMEHGDKALTLYPLDQQVSFKEVIKSQYEVKLDYCAILDIIRKLGKQQAPWQQVWQYFANAPHKYPQIIKFLRNAKPNDLGTGMFAYPKSSWPQVNEEEEKKLVDSIQKLKNKDLADIEPALSKLESENQERRSWIWAELDQAPMAKVLPDLIKIAQLSSNAFPTNSIQDLVDYYVEEGAQIDSALRAIYCLDLKDDHLKAIQVIVDHCYKPWLEKISEKFQQLIQTDHSVLYPDDGGKKSADFILFVDAFRFDLAKEFCEKHKEQFQIKLGTSWSAIPSLTPTSKPSLAPIIKSISKESEWSEFKPQLDSGKFLTPYYFNSEMSKEGYHIISNPSGIDDPEKKYWMEIGDIDKKGHQEQESMFRRIPEMMVDLERKVKAIIKKGVKEIEIVTDHGWLLLPGKLPKESLHRDLTQTRWGRCALLKEGAKTDYLHLPWTWNPNTFIAFAPGISFFKKNEAYAHGGISIHECLTPTVKITAQNTATISACIEGFEWKGMRLNVTTRGTDDKFKLDVRTKRDDSKTSVMENCRTKGKDNWTLIADGDYEGQAATLLLFNQKGIIVDKKLLQIGG